jgi:hypothetical protein
MNSITQAFWAATDTLSARAGLLRPGRNRLLRSGGSPRRQEFPLPLHELGIPFTKVPSEKTSPRRSQPKEIRLAIPSMRWLRMVLPARPVHGFHAQARVSAALPGPVLERRALAIPVPGHAPGRLASRGEIQPACGQRLLCPPQRLAPGHPQPGHMNPHRPDNA